ncbi:MAG TPA: PQQ-dependent sugar dehydrogenase [Dermatophilaceae bacterium]|nr:PQQ-dependent sugar dehydrogenase [Dermatophilaceae bacterium]
MRRVAVPPVVLLLLAGCSAQPPVDAPPPSASPVTSSRSAAPSTLASSATTTAPAAAPVDRPTVVARKLNVPWGLAFLPDGSALVTSRDEGRVLRVRRGAATVEVGTVPGVEPGGEGGLLGVAVSPDFASDGTVFVYLTAAEDNRVLRMTLRDKRLREDKVVVDGIPKAINHNGGRLAFGPDGYLYIGTGDAMDPGRSQDRESLGGKILRVTRDGAPAPGNPFGNRVWTLGHRNVQGLAWDGHRRMFASEFGQNTWDELNRIEPGRNYGWPDVEGRGGRGGFTDPLVQWPTADASPSGIAVGTDGAVYLAALRGESLWRVPIRDDGPAAEPRRLLRGDYGRLRTVERDSAGNLWVVTSNTFRGNPGEDDDRVIVFPAAVE